MKSSFQIHPVGRFAGNSEPIKRPKVNRFTWFFPPCMETLYSFWHHQEFAYFSYDSEHNFRQDDSSLKWYYPPDLGSDLSKGFEVFVKHDDSKDEHLDGLLKTIISYEKGTGEPIDAHVVTWRGIMTKVTKLVIAFYTWMHLY